MVASVDYLNPTRHFWHRCAACTKAGMDDGLQEYIKLNGITICAGCDPMIFHKMKYGEFPTIQRPSKEEQKNRYEPTDGQEGRDRLPPV